MEQAGDVDEATVMSAERVEQSRWVIPAKKSQMLVVQFQSPDMGSFKENLVFEASLLYRQTRSHCNNRLCYDNRELQARYYGVQVHAL